MKKNTIIIIVSVLIVAVGLCFILPPLLHAKETGAEQVEPAPLEEKEEPVALTICAVGDVMVHRSQLTAQYESETGTYNFENNFVYISPYIEQADLALCNVETTFGGEPYSGYPRFSAPDTLGKALKDAGFDVALTSNNHALDTETSGLKRTVEVLRSAGLATEGTHLTGEPNYIVTTANGISVGVVAYTYETPMVNGKRTMNGSYVSDDAWPLINTFSYENLDEDLNKIKESIGSARADGAEIVICYFHWGEEYEREPNEYQKKIAKAVAGFGADIIFASHPHVLQSMEWVTDENTGKEVPVFYSMGNFISNQRLETLDNRYTEQGMVAKVNVSYMKSTKTITSITMNAIPTWVEKYKKNSNSFYYVIPLDENLLQNPAVVEAQDEKRAAQALQDIRELLKLDDIE